ncbi:MAG: protein translocase subunit SecF [Acidimicrobiales bacterium]
MTEEAAGLAQQSGPDSGAVESGAVGKRRSIWSRLYRGETAFDVVGKSRRWFLLSGTVILIGLVSLFARGLNLGIEFSGGMSWEVAGPHVALSTVRTDLAPLGLRSSTIQVLGGRTIEVQADVSGLSPAKQASLKAAVSSKLAALAHTSPSTVSINQVGPTWGASVTTKAEEALGAFFLVVSGYIALRFEWKMAVAALIEVVHDVVITVGIYSISGFQVTPSTVIAFLTILGYSLYDTIVVFDKVQENAKGLGTTGRMTYSDTVNLSMNQVMMRSINTTLVAVMPVLSVLVVGAFVLGAVTLENFSLALLIGLITGAYSSIFIASPLVAAFKEREPRYAAIRAKLAARGGGSYLLTPAAAAAMSGGGTGRGGNGSGAMVSGAIGGGAIGASLGRAGGASEVREPARPGEPAERGGDLLVPAGAGGAPGARARGAAPGGAAPGPARQPRPSPAQRHQPQRSRKKGKRR